MSETPEGADALERDDWLKIAKRNAKDFPTEITVRELIAKWNARGRGQRVVKQVRAGLRTHGLTTEPDFSTGHIDSRVKIIPMRKGASGTTDESRGAMEFLQVDSLRSARQPVSRVTPDDAIAQAMTMMAIHDYSQLAATVGERDIKGAISWESIGRATQFRAPNFVREALSEVKTVAGSDELLPHLRSIAENGFVFVTGPDRCLTGIVTAADITDEFGELAEPFFLLGAIERRLRECIRRGKFSAEEIKEVITDPSKSIQQIDDLSLGEIILIMQPSRNWDRLGSSLDRKVFLERMDRVREIRNALMHFSPDPPSSEDILMLRNTAALLKSWVGD